MDCWSDTNKMMMMMMMNDDDDDCSVNVRLSPLQYSDVFVNGVKCRALQDSGAQLPLISQSVCDRVKAEVCGHIQLQGVVGDPVRAPLVDVVINPVMNQTLLVKMWARKAFTLGVEWFR